MRKIFQIVEDMTKESGGVRTVLVNLEKHLEQSENLISTILTNKKDKNDKYLEFPPNNFKFWNYSKELKNYLNSQSDIDVLHLHGVFMHPQYISSKFAQNNKLPYIISSHGMLEPWHLNDKKLKKSVYLALFLKNILSKSKVLHAITPIEKESLFNLSRHKNIVEIPNFIHHNSIPKNLTYNPNEEYLLFVGRIHPKKGLDLFINVMCKIENKKIKLKIVGEENNYSIELKKMSKQLGIENRIEFVGGVYGDNKYKLFADAKAFIAPSYSEAIGMVNLEAAVCKTPVITTFNTGINSEWKNNGGILINPTVLELTKAINEVTNFSSHERGQRGNMLSNYVVKNYSWEEKGYLWNELYESL